MSNHNPSVGATEILRDALARVVTIRDALSDGDYGFAAEVAADLEHDLVAFFARSEGAE